ncbi:MAG: hypothetical protein LCH96_02720 [Actinobacteria bacterium]|nr:hypothetical protein [Actinomycetota bacterium]
MAGAGRSGGRGLNAARTAVAVLLALLAGLAACLGVVADRAHELVGDTDAFVATYSPVVSSQPVQEVLTRRLTDAVVQQLGFGENRLLTALVGRVVTEAAGSDLFADATTAGLRLAHDELVSLLTDDPGRLQVVDGQVQLRFAPFADALKERLTAAGVPFLDRLPQVSGGITLVTVDPALLPGLQTGYRVLDALSGWLPWLALALAVLAVWTWPGVRTGLITLGACLLGWALLFGGVLGWGAQALLQRVGEDVATVAGSIVSLTVAPMASPLLAIGVTGLVFVTLAALSVPDPARAAR